MEQTQNQLSNRRQSLRHQIQLRILFQRSGATHFVDAETHNISVDGVYIWTQRRPLDVGTDVSLLLKLSDLKKELMLEGVVTWVQHHEPTGMGIRFKEVDPESKKILSDALQ
jgi:uncharacterized protein (TIGR02266 family)